MPVRVTQGMMNTQLLNNINKNIRKMDQEQTQLSTGRRINNPSDDPVGITYSMRYRTELGANDQYQRNVDAATSNLGYLDTMLGQAGDVLQKVRELAVKGANGSNPQTAMDALKVEVEELYKQLLDIGNSKFKGKYVFNGQMTDTPPYTAANAVNEATDNGIIKFEVGAGMMLPVNITGNQAFGDPIDPAVTDGMFKIVNDLITNLGTGNYQAVSNGIDSIDTRMEKLLEMRSEIGARTNRIEFIENRLDDISINLESLQSKTEDADMAEIITKLKMSENVYQASLSVGSKLIQPSLIDYLR
ncbi:flagellar hook-associated protein FlgL [Paenibacillus sedimenti]|uniref:Flagellar hook-associated protein FlgL n=1 Tax=Paenibacillus sedimenti TaxID=2770274 RepID=A0A926KU10_9BACL|nr:flagellar hook-associated protein FlgL [Paenibacillus sedimenti]MBD0384182.1 flagellar hook-associated protein FlgL [Paenibacillus sedimenti]